MTHSSITAGQPWYLASRPRRLLAMLGPQDVRLELRRSCPGPDHFAWAPDTAHGARIFAALTHARTRASNPCATAPPPTLAQALIHHLPDPARWQGLDPVDATRRFRANTISRSGSG